MALENGPKTPRKRVTLSIFESENWNLNQLCLQCVCVCFVTFLGSYLLQLSPSICADAHSLHDLSSQAQRGFQFGTCETEVSKLAQTPKFHDSCVIKFLCLLKILLFGDTH